MERKIPKNVRQIGNVCDSLKIYVEDYVDTYLNQLCEKEADMPVGAALIGEIVKEEEREYQYIYGAVKMNGLLREEDGVDVTEEIWEECEKTCKDFFEQGKIVGWCAVIPGVPFALNEQLKRMHKKLFPEEEGIFVLKDPVSRDEMYFATKFNELSLMNGHYIYYEKNPAMQNYMISSRKKIGVTPSEVVADRAAKNFRNLIKTKMVMQERYKIGKMVKNVGVFLLFIALMAGISLFHNYDRMKSVQLAVEAMSDTVLEKEIQKDKPKEKKIEKPRKKIEEKEKGMYVVESGDTLAGISKKAYGDYKHVDAISKKNKLGNGNLIYVGQKLVLP